MSQKLNHALHNEEVFNFLCAKPENVDWVITIGFYAAIHFVDHKMFPMNETTTDGNKFKLKTFEEYYNFHYAGKTHPKDKHTARRDLIREKHLSILVNFEWLKSQCWNARYKNYQYKNPQQYIDNAKKHLDAIKKYCTGSQSLFS